MADLRTTLANNTKKQTKDSLGRTFESTADKTDSLGLAAGPVSPLQAKNMGVSPDQAKMAGSSASKSTALRDSAETLSLRDAMRKEKDVASAEGQKKKLTEFTTSFDARLSQLADEAATNAAKGGVTIPAAVTEAQVTSSNVTADPTLVPKITTNINALLSTSTPADAKLRAATELATSLGLDPPTTGSLATFNEAVLKKIGAVFGDTDQTLANAAAKALTDYSKLTVGDLYSSPGVSPGGASASPLGSITELASILNMTETEVKALSLPALKSAMTKMGQDSFSQIADLQRKASDPYTPESERRQIIRTLRRLGAAGVRASEEDYAKAAKAVQSGGTVTFNGRSMSLEEALSDKGVNQMVLDYLDGDSDDKAKMASENQGLVDFIEANKKVFDSAAEKIRGELEKAGTSATTLSNKYDTYKVGNMDVAIPDSLKNLAISGKGTFGAKVDPEWSAILDQIQTGKYGTETVNQLGAFAGNKSNLPYLKSLLKNTDVTTLNSLASRNELDDFIKFQQDYDQATNLDPNSATKLLTGMDANELLGMMRDTLNKAKSGVWGTYPPNVIATLEQIVGVQDPAELKNILLAMQSQRSDPGSYNPASSELENVFQDFKNWSTKPTEGYIASHADGLLNDGKLDDGESQAFADLIMSGKITENEANHVLNQVYVSGGLSGPQRQTIKDALNKTPAKVAQISAAMEEEKKKTEETNRRKQVEEDPLGAGVARVDLGLPISTESRRASPYLGPDISPTGISAVDINMPMQERQPMPTFNSNTRKVVDARNYVRSFVPEHVFPGTTINNDGMTWLYYNDPNAFRMIMDDPNGIASFLVDDFQNWENLRNRDRQNEDLRRRQGLAYY